MALKKSQLYSHIWDACDELRGGMDASQYKDYVLVLLFVRYVTDKYANQKRGDVVIPEGGSFRDLSKLKGKTSIGDGINKVLAKLAKANNLSGVIDAVDFNDPDKLGSGEEMQDRLTKLVAIFEDPGLDFSKNRAEGDDLLGDAYEYLMKHFATQSGKSKGQFYTPAEVSRVIAKVIGAQEAENAQRTAYDPACGSGSLLLKVSAESPRGLTLYGQELDNATGTLATINMWVHGQPTADIKKGQSTLSHPLHTRNGLLMTFDYVVANPPFSYKAWRTGFDPGHDAYDRFSGFGMPPDRNGDYAFLLHIVKSMKAETGRGAVVLPHGVLFRGNGEADIRKNLVQRGYIKGIIGLPPNLFFGTGIPACIVVLDKSTAASRKGIFMIDASKGYVKDGSKNRLRERDIKRIVDVFTSRKDVSGFSRFVPNEEIAEPKNDYNLNIPRYVDSSEPEDIQDIGGHLYGGIPDVDIQALSAYWDVCPTMAKKLFKNERKGYKALAVPADEVRQTVLAHPEFTAFRDTSMSVIDAWKKRVSPVLKDISMSDHPKAIIASIGEELLKSAGKLSLVDPYDVFQTLMTYWSNVMQDDVYLITAEGWNAGAQCIRVMKETKKGAKPVPGLAGIEGRLIPVRVLIGEYFAAEQRELDALNEKWERAQADLAELAEEEGAEDGLLGEVVVDGRITKGRLNARIKEIVKDPGIAEQGEEAALRKYLALLAIESETRDAIDVAEEALVRKVVAQYGRLSVDDVKRLVVDRKWLHSVCRAVEGEIDQTSHRLAERLQQLAQRYAQTLPVLAHEVEKLERKTRAHLKTMGFI